MMKVILLGIGLAVFPVIGGAQAPDVLPPEQQTVPGAQPLGEVLIPESTNAVVKVSGPAPGFVGDIRPPARSGYVPRTRWEHRQGNAVWTRAALSALKHHGEPLVDMVPGDIANWCPAYPNATDRQRRAFWVGFLSALAKYESNYRPTVVGGGGKWYGLMQILPGTARGYKCRAGTGSALKNGAANLSCAIRIMARTVPRDGVIHGYKKKRGQGVTADWGPMHSAAKRREMQQWLKRQNYCKPVEATRPSPRP